MITPEKLDEIEEAARAVKDNPRGSISRAISTDMVIELINEVRLAKQRLGPAGYKILEELKESRARVLELEKALSGVSIQNKCWCDWDWDGHTAACLQAFRALNRGEMNQEGQ
jgi:hypothetical protein